MSHATITLSRTSNKYPNLRKTRLHSYTINGNEQPEKDKRIFRDVANYLFINPNKHIYFRNKIPEKNLGKAFALMVQAHNLKRKLIQGRTISKKERAGTTLERLVKGCNLIKKIGGNPIPYFGELGAGRYFRRMARG